MCARLPWHAATGIRHASASFLLVRLGVRACSRLLECALINFKKYELSLPRSPYKRARTKNRRNIRGIPEFLSETQSRRSTHILRISNMRSRNYYIYTMQNSRNQITLLCETVFDRRTTERKSRVIVNDRIMTQQRA